MWGSEEKPKSNPNRAPLGKKFSPSDLETNIESFLPSNFGLFFFFFEFKSQDPKTKPKLAPQKYLDLRKLWKDGFKYVSGKSFLKFNGQYGRILRIYEILGNYPKRLIFLRIKLWLQTCTEEYPGVFGGTSIVVLEESANEVVIPFYHVSSWIRACVVGKGKAVFQQ